MSNEELIERYYDKILAWVIRDEPKLQFEEYFNTNNIAKEQADFLYKKARAERIAFLRKGGIKKMLIGLIPLVAAVIAMVFMYSRPDLARARVWSLICLKFTIAGYFFITGLNDVLTAGSRKGELANYE